MVTSSSASGGAYVITARLAVRADAGQIRRRGRVRHVAPDHFGCRSAWQKLPLLQMGSATSWWNRPSVETARWMRSSFIVGFGSGYTVAVEQPLVITTLQPEFTGGQCGKRRHETPASSKSCVSEMAGRSTGGGSSLSTAAFRSA